MLDQTNEDQVSIFDFADFSDSLGMPEAFELLIKKCIIDSKFYSNYHLDLPDIPAALPESKSENYKLDLN